MAKFESAPRFVVRELEKAAKASKALSTALDVARKLPAFRVKGPAKIEYTPSSRPSQSRFTRRDGKR